MMKSNQKNRKVKIFTLITKHKLLLLERNFWLYQLLTFLDAGLATSKLYRLYFY